MRNMHNRKTSICTKATYLKLTDKKGHAPACPTTLTGLCLLRVAVSGSVHTARDDGP